MSRVSGYPSRPPSRPASEQLCDLHVYKVPLDLWRAPLNNILNQSVTDTVSLGIIRVPPDLPLIDLRAEITRQLEDQAPKDYVFLRSVGRSLTWLKSKQEIQLKAKHFLPPVHYAPELFLLEASPEMREALAISDRSSQQSPSSLHHGSTGHGYQNSNRGYGTYRDGYRNKDGYPGDRRIVQRVPDRASPTRRYTPLPKIDASSSQPQSQEGSPAFFTDVGADSRDSFDNNNYHQASTFRPDPRSRQRYKDREEDYSPSQDYDGHKENQQVATRREGDRRYHEQHHQQHPPPKDTYRRHENSDSETVSPHSPTERHPQRSAEHSPVRKGQAGSVHKGGSHERDAAYTTNTNEDSGVAGLTPEDQYKNRDKENFYLALQNKSKDMQNRLNREHFNVDDDDDYRLKDMDERALLDRDRWEADQRDRRRRAAEDRYRSEEERKREEEEERRRAEEEEERRRAEEEKRRAEEDEEAGRRAEDAKSKTSNKRDLDRFPSPPTLRMSSPDLEIPRDTESARRRRRQEREKLLAELEDAREARHGTEKEREELVKKAKNLQNKTQNRRNHARDVWKKRYFDEKKKTAPLEEQTNRLREELETLHRKLMNTLEGPKEKNVKLGDKHPSQKNNFVIQCTKLQHEIDDLRRRVENAKMKLTAEMKLRNQAEAELRALRAELVQKKINLTLTRSQQFAALSHGMSNETLVKPAVPGIPHGKGEAQALQS